MQTRRCAKGGARSKSPKSKSPKSKSPKSKSPKSKSPKSKSPGSRLPGAGHRKMALHFVENLGGPAESNVRRSTTIRSHGPSKLSIPTGVTRRTRNFILEYRKSGVKEPGLERFVRALIEADLEKETVSREQMLKLIGNYYKENEGRRPRV